MKEKKIGYDKFVIGVYTKENEDIILTQYVEEKSYTEGCKTWKEIKNQHTDIWSITGLKCVYPDNTFNVRFLTAQGGAHKDNLPEDSIFSLNNITKNSETNIDTNILSSETDKIEIKDIEENPTETISTEIIIDAEKESISPERQLINSIKKKHLSELNMKDICEGLATYWNILKEKTEHSNSLYSYFTKERDCVLHNLEYVNESLFENKEDAIKFNLDAAKKITVLSKNRRQAKNDYLLGKKYISEFMKLNDESTKIHIIDEKHPLEGRFELSPNLKTYTYTYETLDEKEELIYMAKLNHSVVIDFKPGIIKAYNRNSKKYNANELEEMTEEITQERQRDMPDEHFIKEGKLIIRYGQKIPTEKGSSIVIKGVTQKIIRQIKKQLTEKYQSIEIADTQIILNNRLKK